MKLLLTTLAIALSIGTAIAALHPPGTNVREGKPAASLSGWTGAKHDDAVRPVHYNYTPPPPAILIPSHRPVIPTPFPPNP